MTKTLRHTTYPSYNQSNLIAKTDPTLVLHLSKEIPQDEKNSTWYDYSNYGNHGTIYGAQYTSEGLSFDGVDDYVHVSDSEILHTVQNGRVMSIGTWINVKGNPTGNWFIVNKQHFIQFWHWAGSLTFQLKFSDDTWRGPFYSWTPALDVWYHVIGTYDGSTIKLYINGIQVATTSYTDNLFSQYDNMRIGNYMEGGYPFNGLIDNVRIYNRALSDTEISTLYNRTKQEILYRRVYL